MSWPEARGATRFDVQVYDMITNERVHGVTVNKSNSLDVPLTKVEPNRQYTFYVTGLGNDSQRGNTVSCGGITGTYFFKLLVDRKLTLVVILLSGSLFFFCRRYLSVSERSHGSVELEHCAKLIRLRITVDSDR